MKKEFWKRVKTIVVPAALAIALVAFSPAAALAANHGGHGGGFNGGHSFTGPAHGNFNSGHVYGGRIERYAGPRYYRPGFSFGVGIYAAPYYGYSVPVCNPAGYYDGAGNWQYYPGCVTPPYGY
jgi:hypothetical protein